MSQTYNPLDKVNLGKSVAEALLDRPVAPLKQMPQFEGAGIYAIYYNGPFPAYARLKKRNAEEWVWPLYIGKAIPQGGRKGSLLQPSKGHYLWRRLGEHAESITLATNLDLQDFSCRYLIVDDIWIPLGETLLITRFKPVWNQELDGFGNHDPGAGRYKGLRPMWDVLHPGRVWAVRCRERPDTAAELTAKVRAFLKTNEPPEEPRMDFSPGSNSN